MKAGFHLASIRFSLLPTTICSPNHHGQSPRPLPGLKVSVAIPSAGSPLYPSYLSPSPKPQVVRGARACTVCRAAKVSHLLFLILHLITSPADEVRRCRRRPEAVSALQACQRRVCHSPLCCHTLSLLNLPLY